MLGFSMERGLWLKGEVHCHTTVSDGLLSPREVASFYRMRGYDFLVISDHESICRLKDFDGIYQPGVEVSRGKCRLGEPYHIVALGVDDQAILDIKDAQLFIDYVNEMGGLTFIAHPYWSGLLHEDLVKLENYVGVEVYNTGCDVEVAKGYSQTHWDNLLSSHRKVWGLAVDDAHRYFLPPEDADGGWVWINVDDPDPDEVLKSIREGRFYSSMAPKITNFKLESDLLCIESSPISRLNIVTANGRGVSVSLETVRRLIDCWSDPHKREFLYNDLIKDFDHVKEEQKQKVYVETIRDEKFMIEMKEEGLTKFEMRREFKYPYVRVEVLDKKGRCAWVNPATYF